MNIELELDLAKNAFGEPLTDFYKGAIRQYLDNPTLDNWDIIHGIIIDKHFTTLWQAVIAVDTKFPRTGRGTDVKGTIVKEWSRIPSPDIVRRALINHLH